MAKWKKIQYRLEFYGTNCWYEFDTYSHKSMITTRLIKAARIMSGVGKSRILRITTEVL